MELVDSAAVEGEVVAQPQAATLSVTTAVSGGGAAEHADVPWLR